MTAQDQSRIWETYTSSWSADSDEARRKAYTTCLTEDCVYKDPNIETHGYKELASYMAGLQAQIPGAGFVTRRFVTHHDSALISWDMLDAARKVISPGTSVGVFAEDGRLRSMTGFFEPQSFRLDAREIEHVVQQGKKRNRRCFDKIGRPTLIGIQVAVQ